MIYVDTFQSNLVFAGLLFLASLLIFVALCFRPKTPDAIRAWADKSGLGPEKPEVAAKRVHRLVFVFSFLMALFFVISAIFICLAFTIDSRKERELEYQRKHMWPSPPLNLEPQPHPFAKKQETQQSD